MTKEQVVLLLVLVVAGWGFVNRASDLGPLPPIEEPPPPESPVHMGIDETGVAMPRLADPGTTVGRDPLRPIDIWRPPRPAPLAVPPDLPAGPAFPANYWDGVEMAPVRRIPALPRPVQTAEGGSDVGSR